MKRFPDRPRVVITGAAGGLGRALALEFAARKARVLVADVDSVRGQETVELVGARGGEALFQRCDVTIAEDLAACEARARAAWGGTDVLVNNAGVAAGGDIGVMPLADWEWLLRINLFGVIHGCHAFVPRMREAKRGYLLNVASIAAFASFPHMAAYGTSKAAIVALSEALRAESGLNVSVLCPWFFRTGLMKGFRGGERERALADGFFRLSELTSESVARRAVRGLEKGALLIFPDLRSRWMSRTKRWFPSLHAWLSRGRAREAIERVILWLTRN
jgi:NAD(P)-dependent dehydrogenase (short-subunit alcohol dehydrogenase family)